MHCFVDIDCTFLCVVLVRNDEIKMFNQYTKDNVDHPILKSDMD